MSVNTDVDPTSSPGDRSNQSPTQHNGGNNRLYARSLTKAIHNSKYPKTMLDLNEIKNFEKRIADLEKLVYCAGIGAGEDLRIETEETPLS